MFLEKHLKPIFSVYKKAAKNFGWFLILLAVAGAVSVVIVLPLWYAATRSRQVYTVIVLGALAAALTAYAIIRLVRAMKATGSGFWSHLGGIAGKVGVLIVFVLGLYGIIWLFSERLYAPAGASLLVYLVLLGVYRSWRSRKPGQNADERRISSP